MRCFSFGRLAARRWLLGHHLGCQTRSSSGGLHESALQALSCTPVIRLHRVAPKGVDVYVKCEAFNPLISMQDRLSVGLVEWAEAHGKIRSGQTIVAALSGSTGIGLTRACAERGYPLVFVCSESSDVEWRRLLRFMGARVLVAGNPQTTARAVAQQGDGFLAEEFQSEASPWIHAQKTGPEILEALGDRRLDYFVAPHGTGGMLKGVVPLLKKRSPSTRIIVVEQDSRPHPDYERMNGPHPSWPQSIVKGWTTDFKPTSINSSVKSEHVDETINISGKEAMETVEALAKVEGIFTGISGGTLAAGALRVAKQAPPGSSVLTVLLDTSPVRLSTPLLDGVPGEMSEDERQLLEASLPPMSSSAAAALDCH